MKNLLLMLFFFLLVLSCTSQVEPKPYGPVPSASQMSWHEMEYFSLICFGLNTYTEQEWAYGDVDPKLFNPSDLDTDQWARVAKEAGMKGLILVSKHHDGFCLWPSKYTDYSVAATPWKNGNGDVLGDLSKSCKKYGLKLGVYLSPWDRNHAGYGRSEYVEYYYNQLDELMTEYGDVFEFWIDGANGGTGYYGGAKDNRSINRETYYGYDKIFDIVKKHQPNAVIFSDVGPGSRWVGNEVGLANETNWNTITTKGRFPGDGSPDYLKYLGTGKPGGENWTPAEADTPLTKPHGWYHHTGRKPRSLQNMVDLYYTSIGRGAVLNLGIAIAPSGNIKEADEKVLLNFKKHMDREFEENLVGNANIAASDTRSEGEYSLKYASDNDTRSYWATNDNVKTATLTIDFKEPTTFNRLMLQEAIELGQRVHEFKLEVEMDGQYVDVASGTTIGYKRVLRFADFTSSKARITLKTEAPCLTLSNIGIYNAPQLVPDPVSNFDLAGNLHFSADNKVSTYYAIGESPKAGDFKKYTTPVKMPFGGKISSFSQDETSGYKTEVFTEEYGISKDKWKVITVDGVKNGEAKKAIDNKPQSFFLAAKKKSNQPAEIVIDMRSNNTINRFSYLTRQDGQKEGIIYEYAFYASKNGKKWSKYAEGTFSNIENSPNRRIIKLENAVNARYIKLVSKSDVRQSGSASFAEIEVFSNK